ncbi:MAG: hypothetical protein ACOYOE_09285 [Chlorobium sp.]
MARTADMELEFGELLNLIARDNGDEHHHAEVGLVKRPFIRCGESCSCVQNS